MFYFFNFFLKCIYFARQREQRRGRDKGRERIPGRLCVVSTEPDVRLEPTNCEIVTWAETKSWMLNQLSHPGTPESTNSLKKQKWSSWVAQLVEHPTLGFCSGHDLTLWGGVPCQALHWQHGDCDSLSLPLSPSLSAPLHYLFLSFSQYKHFKK